MSKYLFDKKISAACKYCFYAKGSKGNFSCSKKGSVDDNDKCVRFKYDPTMREPELLPIPAQLSAENFKL